MITKTITYTDYNGVEKTENFNFNLSKSELIDMELTTPGGFANYLQKIIDSKDYPSIAKMVKRVIFMSYGVKSPDGKRFMKSEQLSEEFAQTPAYDKLYMEFVTDAKAGADFINGLIPDDMVDAVNEAIAKNAKDNENIIALPDGNTDIDD